MGRSNLYISSSFLTAPPTPLPLKRWRKLICNLLVSYPWWPCDKELVNLMYGTMFRTPTHPPTERDKCGKLSSTSFALNIDVILGALATVLKTRGCSREKKRDFSSVRASQTLQKLTFQLHTVEGKQTLIWLSHC